MRDKNLNQIVSDVRKAYKKGKLGEDQIRRLDDIGFDFIGQKARGVTLRESVADLLRTYPHEYTYSEIANIFDVDWNVCYRIIRYQGLEELVKPVRGRVNIAGLLDDYENIRDVNALAVRYGITVDYVRAILRRAGKTLPKFIDNKEAERICALRLEGKSLTEIANIVGRNAATVAKVLNEADIAAGSRKTSSCRRYSKAKPISDEEKKEIIRLRNNGMTITAIAKSVGRSGTAVGEVLRQNGFETDLRIPKQVIAQAETLIREGDKSYREIAALLGMSTSNVSRVAKSIGAESNYKHNAKRVLCIESGEIFSSATEAQLHLSTPNSGGVSAACKSGKKYKGCHWKYVDDEDDR